MFTKPPSIQVFASIHPIDRAGGIKFSVCPSGCACVRNTCVPRRCFPGRPAVNFWFETKATVSCIGVFCYRLINRNVHADLRRRLGRPNARVLRQPGSGKLGWQQHRPTIVGVWNRRHGLYTDIYCPRASYCRPFQRRTNVLII